MEIKKIYNKILFYSIFFVILIFLIIGIFKNLKKDQTFDYIFDGDMKYSIDYKENYNNIDNISTQNLFVSSIVENILVDIIYKFSLNENLRFKYKYEVNANVISMLDDSTIESNEIYRKKQNLIKTNYTDVFSNSFSIENEVSLNYDLYNKIAFDYNNSVNVPVKSKLQLELVTYVKFDNGQTQEFKEFLILPLEQNTFSISKNNKQYDGQIYNNNKQSQNIVFSIVLIVIIFIYLGLMLFEFIKFLNYKKQHYLEFKYRKIMRDYDNIVVPINALPKDDNIVCVKVLYFKSMIDMQKELHLPILCYKKDNIIIYMILNNKLAYIYFLNNNKEKI